MKVKLGKLVKLKDLKCGSLFLYGKTVGLKTEYVTDGKCDAYIVEYGEYFWGGTDNATDRENLMVYKLKLKL